MTIEIKINDEDMKDLLDNVHDCYYDITGESVNDIDLSLLASQLPQSTLAKVAQWGGNDSEVRDEIYRWIKNGRA